MNKRLLAVHKIVSTLLIFIILFQPFSFVFRLNPKQVYARRDEGGGEEMAPPPEEHKEQPAPERQSQPEQHREETPPSPQREMTIQQEMREVKQAAREAAQAQNTPPTPTPAPTAAPTPAPKPVEENKLSASELRLMKKLEAVDTSQNQGTPITVVPSPTPAPLLAITPIPVPSPQDIKLPKSTPTPIPTAPAPAPTPTSGGGVQTVFPEGKCPGPNCDKVCGADPTRAVCVDWAMSVSGLNENNCGGQCDKVRVLQEYQKKVALQQEANVALSQQAVNNANNLARKLNMETQQAQRALDNLSPQDFIDLWNDSTGSKSFTLNVNGVEVTLHKVGSGNNTTIVASSDMGDTNDLDASAAFNKANAYIVAQQAAAIRAQVITRKEAQLSEGLPPAVQQIQQTAQVYNNQYERDCVDRGNSAAECKTAGNAPLPVTQTAAYSNAGLKSLPPDARDLAIAIGTNPTAATKLTLNTNDKIDYWSSGLTRTYNTGQGDNTATITYKPNPTSPLFTDVIVDGKYAMTVSRDSLNIPSNNSQQDSIDKTVFITSVLQDKFVNVNAVDFANLQKLAPYIELGKDGTSITLKDTSGDGIPDVVANRLNTETGMQLNVGKSNNRPNDLNTYLLNAAYGQGKLVDFGSFSDEASQQYIPAVEGLQMFINGPIQGLIGGLVKLDKGTKQDQQTISQNGTNWVLNQFGLPTPAPQLQSQIASLNNPNEPYSQYADYLVAEQAMQATGLSGLVKDGKLTLNLSDRNDVNKLMLLGGPQLITTAKTQQGPAAGVGTLSNTFVSFVDSARQSQFAKQELESMSGIPQGALVWFNGDSNPNIMNRMFTSEGGPTLLQSNITTESQYNTLVQKARSVSGNTANPLADPAPLADIQAVAQIAQNHYILPSEYGSEPVVLNITDIFTQIIGSTYEDAVKNYPELKQKLTKDQFDKVKATMTSLNNYGNVVNESVANKYSQDLQKEASIKLAFDIAATVLLGPAIEKGGALVSRGVEAGRNALAARTVENTLLTGSAEQVVAKQLGLDLTEGAVRRVAAERAAFLGSETAAEAVGLKVGSAIGDKTLQKGTEVTFESAGKTITTTIEKAVESQGGSLSLGTISKISFADGTELAGKDTIIKTASEKGLSGISLKASTNITNLAKDAAGKIDTALLNKEAVAVVTPADITAQKVAGKGIEAVEGIDLPKSVVCAASGSTACGSVVRAETTVDKTLADLSADSTANAAAVTTSKKTTLQDGFDKVKQWLSDLRNPFVQKESAPTLAVLQNPSDPTLAQITKAYDRVAPDVVDGMKTQITRGTTNRTQLVDQAMTDLRTGLKARGVNDTQIDAITTDARKAFAKKSDELTIAVRGAKEGKSSEVIQQEIKLADQLNDHAQETIDKQVEAFIASEKAEVEKAGGIFDPSTVSSMVDAMRAKGERSVQFFVQHSKNLDGKAPIELINTTFQKLPPPKDAAERATFDAALESQRKNIVQLTFNQHLENPEQYVSHGFDHTLNVVQYADNVVHSNGGELLKATARKYNITEAEAKFMNEQVALFHDVGYPIIGEQDKAAHAVASAMLGSDEQITNNLRKLITSKDADIDLLLHDFRDAILFHGADKIEQQYTVKLITTRGSFLTDTGFVDQVISQFSRDTKASVTEIYVVGQDEAAKLAKQLNDAADLIEKQTGRRPAIPDVYISESTFGGRTVQSIPGTRPKISTLGIEFSEVDALDSPLQAAIRIADNMDMRVNRLSEIQKTAPFQEILTSLGDPGNAKGNIMIKLEGTKDLATARGLFVDNAEVLQIPKDQAQIIATRFNTAKDAEIAWKQTTIDKVVKGYQNKYTDKQLALIRDLGMKENSISMRHFAGTEAIASVSLEGSVLRVEVDPAIFDSLNKIRVQEKGMDGNLVDVGVGEYQIWRARDAYASIRVGEQPIKIVVVDKSGKAVPLTLKPVIQ